MKKIIVVICLLIVIQSISNAQDPNTDPAGPESILRKLDTARRGTNRVLMMVGLANHYKEISPDSAFLFGYQALSLARQINFPKGEVGALSYIIFTHMGIGNYPEALQINLKALKIAERNNLINDKAIFLRVLGRIYNQIEDHRKALDLYREAKALHDSHHDFPSSTVLQDFIGQTYLLMNQPDSALYYCQSAYEKAVQLKIGWLEILTLWTLGRIQSKKGNHDLALAYLQQSISDQAPPLYLFNSYFYIAELYEQINKPDSCTYYANKSLQVIRERGFHAHIIKANVLLSRIYEKNDPQKALEYSKAAILYKDSLYNFAKTVSVKNLIAFDEQERQYEIETAKATYRSQIRQYILIAGLLVFLLIAFILYRNNRHKQKAKAKIEKAYEELKSTQAQLIQREKMASLGELTAGIAHEIQNPLNFVNNFSEVNTELIDELEQEADKGNLHEVKSIVKGIKENEQKIVQHGRRADAIVKGMLQHSRSSTAAKEPADINKLADEYLRLAYHGLRAKDKSFNVTLKTDYDENIGNINIIPQDIGRVILNLITNSFYAVSEKKKQVEENYEPTVSVSTKKINARPDYPRLNDSVGQAVGRGKVEIKVADNGNGIPQNVLNKIFQPFFTTKPTGQGTGLGLSLSYDIVKAHGGEIKVETKENEGTAFIIQLPQ